MTHTTTQTATPLQWREIPSQHASYQPYHIATVAGGQYRLIWRAVDEHYTAVLVADVSSTADECPSQSASVAKMKAACERHHATGNWE